MHRETRGYATMEMRTPGPAYLRAICILLTLARANYTRAAVRRPATRRRSRRGSVIFAITRASLTDAGCSAGLVHEKPDWLRESKRPLLLRNDPAN